MNQQDEILDFEGALVVTKFKAPTLRKLVQTRAIPHYKLGSRLRFKRKEIEAWLNARLKKQK